LLWSAAIALDAGFYYWRQGQLYANTDDACLNVNTVENPRRSYRTC